MLHGVLPFQTFIPTSKPVSFCDCKYVLHNARVTGRKNNLNLKLIRVISWGLRITVQPGIGAGYRTVCSDTKTIWIKSNPPLTVKAFQPLIPSYLSAPCLPAGFDAYPAVGVDAHRGAQHHGLGAQVVRHLDAAVHDGQGDVVGALHAFPAPQQQALRGLGPDAQLEFVHQQSLFTGIT